MGEKSKRNSKGRRNCDLGGVHELIEENLTSRKSSNPNLPRSTPSKKTGGI